MRHFKTQTLSRHCKTTFSISPAKLPQELLLGHAWLRTLPPCIPMGVSWKSSPPLLFLLRDLTHCDTDLSETSSLMRKSRTSATFLAVAPLGKTHLAGGEQKEAKEQQEEFPPSLPLMIFCKANLQTVLKTHRKNRDIVHIMRNIRTSL